MKRYFHALATDQDSGAAGSLVKIFLCLLSFGYGLAVRATDILYSSGILKQHRLDLPVISVGNITWGGVGKTPLVLWMARYVQSLGKMPVVLTRGYMQVAGHDSDEALMMREQMPDVPVVVGRDRYVQAMHYLQTGKADVFILDDGFQHRRLHRDLDVLAVDARNAWGNGWLIPRGILREPRSSLTRADAVVLTKTDVAADAADGLSQNLQKDWPDIPVGLTTHRPVGLKDIRFGNDVPLEGLNQKEVVVLSAIGDGNTFETMVRKLGAQVYKSFHFLDHHIYTANDMEAIRTACEKGRIDTVVTTHKDTVKIRPLTDLLSDNIQVLCLNIEMDITHGKEQLAERVRHLLQR